MRESSSYANRGPYVSGGLYRQERTPLYVNRGIGSKVLPYRLFARPEVTVVRFVGTGERHTGDRGQGTGDMWADQMVRLLHVPRPRSHVPRLRVHTDMRIVALTFHEVIPDTNGTAQAGDPFYRIAVSNLERLLSQLRKLGYQTISSREFRTWQEGTGTLPERTVVLTFDDGYLSHFELVAPLLLRYRFAGTFFVVTGLIGTPGYMSWEHLRKLIFLGMEIGSHGASHRPLVSLSRDQLIEELAGSKRLLEERLGISICAIAAPGGSWNRAVADAVKRAGYGAAWVSLIGTNGRETQPLALRRIVVRQPFSAERMVSMVEGWQPAFWWAASQQYLIRLLKRVLGVYWYEQLKRRLVPNA